MESSLRGVQRRSNPGREGLSTIPGLLPPGLDPGVAMTGHGSTQRLGSPLLLERARFDLETPGGAILLTRSAAIAATPAGSMKKSSARSVNRERVTGPPTTPSTTIRATWMPAGQRWRAINSASARCAILACANAAVPAAPRREAVAPTTMIAPRPFCFIAGIARRALRKRPSVLMRHERSRSSALTSSTFPQTPEPALKMRTSASPRSVRILAKAVSTEASSATSQG